MRRALDILPGRDAAAQAAFIPYSSHVRHDTLLTKDGELLRIWRLDGLAFETADAQTLVTRREQFNALLRTLASEQVALWAHSVRRHADDPPPARYRNDFCQRLHEAYCVALAATRPMVNELFLTLVYRPRIAAGRGWRAGRHRDEAGWRLALQQALHRLDELGAVLEAGLRRYGGGESGGPQVLQSYDAGPGVLCSQPLEFLEFLMTGRRGRLRVPAGPLDHYLGTAALYFGSEMMELRHAQYSLYAQAIDFKEYGTHTEAGMLDGLMYADYEYVITQSFSFVGNRHALAFLQRQRRQLRNVGDAAHSQIADIAQAEDALLDGEFVMGEYHYSMMIFGQDTEALRKHVSEALTIIQERGFLAIPITLGLAAAFYAQLPANWAYRPRVALLTSRNFADLCCFHAFFAGKRDGNPWGDALTVFATPSGQPFYFNFHYSNSQENAQRRMVLGNTRVIGQSGSGKTVLMNMLLCQLQKFSDERLTVVFFDKDRGAEIVLKALGGTYLRLRDGRPTGLNPLLMPASEGNLQFLEVFLQTLVRMPGQTLTAQQQAALSQALRTVMRMPPALRRLTTVLQNLTECDRAQEALVRRLARWCGDDGAGSQGALWWVFDNAQDLVDFEHCTNHGIDGTELLEHPEVSTPVSLYLLHRMTQAMDGRRFVYFMDEAWRWLGDPVFADFVGDQQLTIRKKNGLGVFSTQMPSSLLGSPIAAALVQQCATEIYLPNPRADEQEYVEGFKCTRTEYEIIRSLPEDSRLFLVKQGTRSVLAQLDLSGMDDELAVLSGTAQNLAYFDRAVAQPGDDGDWLAAFQRLRRREGRT
ncbi:VirB4 family type IV secretion/conjugal transfer ATPase [Bordetella pseudohinzii]|uniref:Pertussis toxin liberation protein C n=1 Tax=Bordetella pseudohinzii TaxID=1331258 RepID=A0A0J6C727_9BORD|nr:VirB4 family type IV secretion/conjugal transfer ATPase [Bordetella pseudohinzii]ANY14723.1 type IV secretion protein C [Bordetella pseudohinzii]KMM26923.1 Type IV secretion system protein PtlC [Bordetella pseudohinzii]KXA76226.1 type IV secretion protein C [Bordetella pseudohinzii]KXA78120.1 type IV secretion protein C [Bordetella pseudohinzii]CUI59663.1 Pertussis toxin liberation protein C [Bordetella pseudohinzii]